MKIKLLLGILVLLILISGCVKDKYPNYEYCSKWDLGTQGTPEQIEFYMGEKTKLDNICKDLDNDICWMLSGELFWSMTYDNIEHTQFIYTEILEYFPEIKNELVNTTMRNYLIKKIMGWKEGNYTYPIMD